MLFYDESIFYQKNCIYLLCADEQSADVVLFRGEQVDVVGASPQRGFMLVEHRGVVFHIPSQFMEVKVRLDDLFVVQ